MDIYGSQTDAPDGATRFRMLMFLLERSFCYFICAVYFAVFDQSICNKMLYCRLIKHKDEIQIGSLFFQCLVTPGHTTGHVVYNLSGSQYGCSCDSIFTGDLLFLAGCGNLNFYVRL